MRPAPPPASAGAAARPTTPAHSAQALRQFQWKVGRHNVAFFHVSLVPVVGAVGEEKTKPTQHSVQSLRALGISPDFLVCRSTRPLDLKTKEKLANFCHVPEEQCVGMHDVRPLSRAQPSARAHTLGLCSHARAAALCSAQALHEGSATERSRELLLRPGCACLRRACALACPLVASAPNRRPAGCRICRIYRICRICRICCICRICRHVSSPLRRQVSNIYRVPLLLEEQGILDCLLDKLGACTRSPRPSASPLPLPPPPAVATAATSARTPPSFPSAHSLRAKTSPHPPTYPDRRAPPLLRAELERHPTPILNEWRSLAALVDSLREPVSIAVVGKYTSLGDAYLSVTKVGGQAARPAARAPGSAMRTRARATAAQRRPGCAFAEPALPPRRLARAASLTRARVRVRAYVPALRPALRSAPRR